MKWKYNYVNISKSIINIIEMQKYPIKMSYFTSWLSEMDLYNLLTNLQNFLKQISKWFTSSAYYYYNNIVYILYIRGSNFIDNKQWFSFLMYAIRFISFSITINALWGVISSHLNSYPTITESVLFSLK